MKKVFILDKTNSYMKFAVENEDNFIGLIVGIIAIGASGLYFQLPDFQYVWAGIITLSLVSSVFDIIHSLKDLKWHKYIMPMAILNNILDLIFEIPLAAYFFNYNIPGISNIMVPFFENSQYMFMIGAFFVLSSIGWLIVLRFTK
jgi:hypothetical protein